MTIANVAVLILILGAGAALRLPQLGLKPMHTDEAVQADILMEARESGRYRYDPTEYHGPTLPLFSPSAAEPRCRPIFSRRKGNFLVAAPRRRSDVSAARTKLDCPRAVS